MIQSEGLQRPNQQPDLSKMKIRHALETDLEMILTIMKQSIRPAWGETSVLQEITDPYCFFPVIVYNCIVKGFAILRINSDENQLMQLAVDPLYRGMGLADALMDELIGKVKSMALQNEPMSIILEVRETNIGAKALYEKHGFRLIGTRLNYYTDPVENALIMKLQLQ